MANPPSLRIFISSPGDVAAAREVTAQTIERLALEYRRFFSIEPYLWEHEAMLASGHFQDSIDPPSKFDIVILILGGRLGTPLPERTAVRQYKGLDGRSPVTGTEWEFEDALAAARESGAPDLLVYRSQRDVQISSTDVDVQNRQLQQLEALNAFWTRHFADRGAFIGAYGTFDNLETLAAAIERDLQTLVRKRVGRQVAAEAGQSQPLWLKDPFRGLESYEFEHAPIFFGRREAVGRAMLQLIAQAERGQAFLLVLGASGSGKSSLVKAGIAPRLFEARRVPASCFLRRVVFRPGDIGTGEDIFSALARTLTVRPDGASEAVGLPELLGPSMTSARLAEYLRDAHADPSFAFERCLDDLAVEAKARGRMLEYQRPKMLLIVDQLEELFSTERIVEEERQRFVLLLRAFSRSSCVYVVATMRGDFWHRAAEIPDLVRLAEGDGRLDLVAPSPAELGQMIRMPANVAGLQFEVHPETGISLADRIAEDASSQPGALPLLSFLLETLYGESGGAAQLTYECFERVGRLRGAIASRADQALAAQAPEVRAALTPVMFALVQLSAHNDFAIEQPVIKRAELAKFVPGTPERQLIDALVEARLLVLDRGEPGVPVVRLAHEALITHWAAARECAARSVEALGVRAMVEERLRRARNLQGRDPGGALLVGVDLSDARALARDFGGLLADNLSAFIKRSMAADELAKRADRYRLAGISAAAALLVSGLVGAAWLAVKAHRASEVQRVDRQLLSGERAATSAYARGDLGSALAGFQADQGLARRLIQMDPEEPQWRYNLAASQAYAAYTLAKQSESAQAAVEYHGALHTLVDLAHRDSGRPKIQADRKALQSLLTQQPPDGPPHR